MAPPSPPLSLFDHARDALCRDPDANLPLVAEMVRCGHVPVAVLQEALRRLSGLELNAACSVRNIAPLVAIDPEIFHLRTEKNWWVWQQVQSNRRGTSDPDFISWVAGVIPHLPEAALTTTALGQAWPAMLQHGWEEPVRRLARRCPDIWTRTNAQGKPYLCYAHLALWPLIVKEADLHAVTDGIPLWQRLAHGANSVLRQEIVRWLGTTDGPAESAAHRHDKWLSWEARLLHNLLSGTNRPAQEVANRLGMYAPEKVAELLQATRITGGAKVPLWHMPWVTQPKVEGWAAVLGSRSRWLATLGPQARMLHVIEKAHRTQGRVNLKPVFEAGLTQTDAVALLNMAGHEWPAHIRAQVEREMLQATLPAASAPSSSRIRL